MGWDVKGDTLPCTGIPARRLCLLHVGGSAGVVGAHAPWWAVACQELSGGEGARMSFGSERLEQLRGHLRGKDTEPCTTAHEEVVVIPGQLC